MVHPARNSQFSGSFYDWLKGASDSGDSLRLSCDNAGEAALAPIRTLLNKPNFCNAGSELLIATNGKIKHFGPEVKDYFTIWDQESPAAYQALEKLIFKLGSHIHSALDADKAPQRPIPPLRSPGSNILGPDSPFSLMVSSGLLFFLPLDSDPGAVSRIDNPVVRQDVKDMWIPIMESSLHATTGCAAHVMRHLKASHKLPFIFNTSLDRNVAGAATIGANGLLNGTFEVQINHQGMASNGDIKFTLCHELGHVVMLQNQSLITFGRYSIFGGKSHDPRSTMDNYRNSTTSPLMAFWEGFANFTGDYDEKITAARYATKVHGPKDFGKTFADRQRNEFFVGTFLTILAEAKDGNYDRIVTLAGDDMSDGHDSSLTHFLSAYIHNYPDQKPLLNHLLRRYGLLENEPMP